MKFVGQFEDGLARFEVNKKTGYINTRGEVAIEPKFDKGLPFSEGLALVKVGKCDGFIDGSGEWVVPPRFYHGHCFSEGMAGVRLADTYDMASSGFIDHTGRLIIPATFRKVDRFEDGLCLVNTDRDIGYINRQGEFVWRSPWIDVPIYSNLRP